MSGLRFLTETPCRSRPEPFNAPEAERTDSSAYRSRVHSAVEICLTCPLMLACRDEGRRRHQTGIWGGETDEERAAAGYPPENYRHSVKSAPCGTQAGAQRHRRSSHKPCTACLKAEREARVRRDARQAAAA